MNFSVTNSLIGVFTGIHGFNIFRWGNVFGIPTIAQIIRENGREIIRDQDQKSELYIASYKRNRKEIEESNEEHFRYAYDIWTGGKLLEEWCDKHIDTKISLFSGNNAEKIAIWCTVSKNVENTLIKSGKQVIENAPYVKAKFEYMNIYSTKKSDNSFLKDVMNNNSTGVQIEDKGWQSVQHWCKQALTRYGDSSNSQDSIFQNAQKWCVIGLAAGQKQQVTR